MNLSISNIAWDKSNDAAVYKLMNRYQFSGLEIAPTRIIEQSPYDHCSVIEEFAKKMNHENNIKISSMQSIWFGRTENLFSSEHEYQTLMDYTKKAIDFASSANCKNLVFGSPKNRIISNTDDLEKAKLFFEEIGNYACQQKTYVALEANPTIYGTNFINTTKEAIEFVSKLETQGVKVNFDFGTFIFNEEDLSILEGNLDMINHIHISEPYLLNIEKRAIHHHLSCLLKKSNYNQYISIEMKKQTDLKLIEDTMCYIMEVFK